eukprot:3680392-Amphidinium_carterae.1
MGLRARQTSTAQLSCPNASGIPGSLAITTHIYCSRVHAPKYYHRTHSDGPFGRNHLKHCSDFLQVSGIMVTMMTMWDDNDNNEEKNEK